jgi:hypothetical protein
VAEADAGSPPPPVRVTRFVAIGDSGKGNDTQYKVSRAMETVCAARGGCAFGVMLGDNIYPSGVPGPQDPQFQDKFEKPYANLPFAFYVVLGNHDYGRDGAGTDLPRGQHEVDYSRYSQKWRMPAAYYRVTEGPVEFFGLDTNSIFLNWGNRRDQERDVPAWIGASRAPWKIAFGHHPYRSNGPHGNAGKYDNIPLDSILVAGEKIKTFVERHLCGKVDVYLAGHDHSLQDLGKHCGTEFLVSGGGASNTDLPGSGPSLFGQARPGFLLLEATDRTLTVAFHDEAGTKLHERTITK